MCDTLYVAVYGNAMPRVRICKMVKKLLMKSFLKASALLQKIDFHSSWTYKNDSLYTFLYNIVLQRALRGRLFFGFWESESSLILDFASCSLTQISRLGASRRSAPWASRSVRKHESTVNRETCFEDRVTWNLFRISSDTLSAWRAKCLASRGTWASYEDREIV